MQKTTGKSSDRFGMDGEQEGSGPPEPNNNDFETVFKRIKIALDIKHDVQLGKLLGIRQSSIAGAKKRGTVPSNWIIKLAKERDISADWLLFGEKPMHRSLKQLSDFVLDDQVKRIIDACVMFATRFQEIDAFIRTANTYFERNGINVGIDIDRIKALLYLSQNALNDILIAAIGLKNG